MNIHLHIDRLVLEGLPLEAQGQAAFQAALEAEVGRALARRGIARELAGGIALPHLDGGTLRWNGTDAPGALGRQVGSHLAGVLSGGGKP